MLILCLIRIKWSIIKFKGKNFIEVLSYVFYDLLIFIEYKSKKYKISDNLIKNKILQLTNEKSLVMVTSL